METVIVMPFAFKAKTRARRRHNDVKKAIRKQNIANSVYPKDENWNYYSNLHQYSKNKIHCSCYFCSCKTRDKKKRYSPPISQRRRIDEMDYEIEEMNLLR